MFKRWVHNLRRTPNNLLNHLSLLSISLFLQFQMGSTNHTEAAEMDAALQALKLTTISSLPLVLKTVIQLDLLEIIAKAGPGASFSASDLSAQLPTKNPDAPVMLDRMLGLLSSFSVLKCSLKHLPDGRSERLYGLSPVGKLFTKDNHGGSWAALLLLTQSRPYMESWHYSKEAILEGGYPFNKAYGMNLFEYFAKDAAFGKVFNDGLSDYTTVIINRVLDIYDGFQGLQTLVDVGGGLGSTITAIVSKYPKLKGINFDLPHVVEHAPSRPGVEHVGGNMFESVPKGDAIFMKSVLHNWGDEECTQLLKKCYEALPENGKVIIADHILPESPDNTIGDQNTLLVDMLMLAYVKGAKERTEKELEALAKKAGFKSFHKICDAHTTWIMEFRK